MAKIATTVLVLRIIQLIAGVAFIGFWIWSCAARYVVGGGVGEYAFGFVAALVSLAIVSHGIWAFARKQHLVRHSTLYRHAAWLIDLLAVVLWLGVILVNILVPIDPQDWERQLGGGPSPDSSWQPPAANDPTVIAAAGISVTELVLVITFFMTALLLFITALRRGPGAKANGKKGNTASNVDEDEASRGVQAPEEAHQVPRPHQRSESGELVRNTEDESSPHLNAPAAAHVRDI